MPIEMAAQAGTRGNEGDGSSTGSALGRAFAARCRFPSYRDSVDFISRSSASAVSTAMDFTSKAEDISGMAEGTAEVKARRELMPIQALRALAASLVLFQHVLNEIAGGSVSSPFFPWDMGVDLFFVISGFLMFYTTEPKFGRTGESAQFLMRRIARVVPLYWIFTSFMVAAAVLVPELLNKTSVDILQIASSYLFWPYQRYDGALRPVLSLGWTLNFEMYFYVVFAGCLLLPRRFVVKALTVVLTSTVVAGLIWPASFVALRFWTAPIVLEFIAGVWLAVLFSRVRVRSSPAALLTLALAVGSAIALHNGPVDPLSPIRIITHGLPAMLILAGAVVLLEARHASMTPKWAVALGDSSYSLYLSHPFVIKGAAFAAGLVLPGAGVSLVTGLLMFAGSLALGHLVHLYVESPLQAKLHALTDRKPRTSVVVEVAA